VALGLGGWLRLCGSSGAGPRTISGGLARRSAGLTRLPCGLGDLAAVWLYSNDRQIKQVSYRETEASHPSYTVTLRALDGHQE
jgi:hypothetical protein